MGRRIKALRQSCGLTQEELAHRACLAVAYFARLESGHLNPTLSTLDRLSSALNIPLADLLHMEEKEKSIAQADSIAGEIQRLVNELPLPEQVTLLRMIKAYSFKTKEPHSHLLDQSFEKAAEKSAVYKAKSRKNKS
ncbi:MAG: helix-turn-helix transcriptional regulator [Firmicutes bacterium]|nr:helix-turn-helix transcriptional regulator [Bacillota bacterium]